MAVGLALATRADAAAQPDPDLAGMPEMTVQEAPPSLPEASRSSMDLNVKGRLRLQYLGDLEATSADGEDVSEIHGLVELEAGGKLSDSLAAAVSGRLTYDRRTQEEDLATGRSLWESELREAQVSWNGGPLTVTVGQQFVRWGSCDISSPNDVINPEDFRRAPELDLATSLWPIPAVRAQVHGTSVGWDLVYLPVFAPHRGYIYNNDWSLLRAYPQLLPAVLQLTPGHLRRGEAEEALLSANTPALHARNGSVGGRMLLNGAGWDLRFNVLYDWDRIPEVRPGPEGLMPTDATYHRQLGFGLDGSIGQSEVVLTGDMRYVPRRTLYSEDLVPVRTAAVSWAVGVEVAQRLILQGFGMMLPLHMADGPRLLFYDWEWANVALVYRDDFFRERLKLMVAGFYGLNRKDHSLSGSVAYVLGPHEFALGGLMLDGPAGSRGGLFGGNDFFSARYTLFF